MWSGSKARLQRIEDLLSRGGIADPAAPAVFAMGTSAPGRSGLLGQLHFHRPYLAVLDRGEVVLLELTVRLDLGPVRRINLAEVQAAVVQTFLGTTQLVFHFRGGERVPLRVGHRFAGFPAQKRHLDALLGALAARGLVHRSTSHIRSMAAGVLIGLLVLGVAPSAIRSWFRAQTERERAVVRAYVERTRTLGAAPESRDYAPADVLGRLETYQAPPMPRTRLSWLTGSLEPYDARLRSGEPVPPTRAEALAEDVKILMARYFPDSNSPFTQAQVARALGLYLHAPWTALPGYRPWTHWNFLRTLSGPERHTLARQVTHQLNDSSQGKP